MLACTQSWNWAYDSLGWKPLWLSHTCQPVWCIINHWPKGLIATLWFKPKGVRIRTAYPISRCGGLLLQPLISIPWAIRMWIVSCVASHWSWQRQTWRDRTIWTKICNSIVGLALCVLFGHLVGGLVSGFSPQAEEDLVERVPFLMLGLDLPPAPLYKDSMEKNIIPQVQLYLILQKYDNQLVRLRTGSCASMWGWRRWQDVLAQVLVRPTGSDWIVWPRSSVCSRTRRLNVHVRVLGHSCCLEVDVLPCSDVSIAKSKFFLILRGDKSYFFGFLG